MSVDRRLFLTGVCCAGAGLATGLTLADRPQAAPVAAPGQDAPAFARERFLSHWICAQAVLEALAPHSGLSHVEVTRLTTPFAAGLWNGMVCGAFSGAAIAIGMRFGRESDGDGKGIEVTKVKMREFMKAMADRFGEVSCSGLLGVDMSTDAGLEEAGARGLYKTRCAGIVEAAAREAAKLMA